MAAPTRQPDARQLHDRLVAASPLTRRTVQSAGVTTAVFVGGEGPPMVLLHGQGECWAVWLNVLEDLVTTHRVIAVDLPGHGDSLEVAGALDADRLVRWVDELVDATCDRSPMLVGHLLGGAIAARYAVANPERLAHLVLVDSMGLAWFRPSLRFVIPMVRFIAAPTPQRRDRLFDRCFADVDAVGERFGDSWDDLRAYVLDRARTDENDAALKAMMPRVGVPAIAAADRDRITVPTTLIHGRDDLQVSVRAAERASRRHGWPLHVIEECRDDPAAEQPEAFLAALREGLDTDRLTHPPTTTTTGAHDMDDQPPTAADARDAWVAIADAFDQHTTPLSLALGEEVVSRLPLGPGVQVLDVAAGTGALGIPAARTGAQVVAIDVAPTMVARLRARADAEGLSTLVARVGDGTALDLDDDSVDVTVSLNGISLFPDIAGGLHEAVRVTRPGGEVAVVTFGPLPQVEFISFVLRAVQAVAPGAMPALAEPLPPFRLADPGALAATLEDAGLRDVTVSTVTWETAVSSVDELLDLFLSSNPIARRITGGLTDEQLGQARQVLGGMVRERSGGDTGAVLSAVVNLGRGTVGAAVHGTAGGGRSD